MNPGLIAGAVQGVVGLGTSIFGGAKANRERKRMEQRLAQEQADNQAWYNANALQDYTQRADTQNLVRNLRENLQGQQQAAANMAVVTGATPEAMAAQRAQSNKVIADTYSNISAAGQQWKDNITNQYLARKDALTGQQVGAMQSNAQSYENLMNQGIGMFNSGVSTIAGGVGGLA